MWEWQMNYKREKSLGDDRWLLTVDKFLRDAKEKDKREQGASLELTRYWCKMELWWQSRLCLGSLRMCRKMQRWRGQRRKIAGNDEPSKPLLAVCPCPVLSCPILPGSSSLFPSAHSAHAKTFIFSPYYSLRLKWLTPVLGQMLTLPVGKCEYLLCGENV